MSHASQTASPRSAKPITRNRKASARGRADASATLPGVAPHRVPKAAPPPPITDSECTALATAALEALRRRLWAGLRPRSVATVSGVEVQAVAVGGARPFWHLLTRGLLVKGFELSLRVSRSPEETAPPAWAIEVLQHLVAAHRAGTPLENGQVVSLGGKLAPGLDTEMTAVALTLDPLFGQVETPKEPVPVLAVVGVTPDEQRLVREWCPTGLLEVLAAGDRLLLTDPERQSLLSSPRARTIIETRAGREGSSMGVAWARHSSLAQRGNAIHWTLSTDAVETLTSLLKGRLGHQRPFSLRTPETRVEVRPAQACAVELERDALTLSLTQAAGQALRASLRAAPGTYQTDALPGLSVTVVP